MSTKSNDTTAASPDPAPVRSLVRVPDAAKYLTFLKEVFGDPVHWDVLVWNIRPFSWNFFVPQASWKGV